MSQDATPTTHIEDLRGHLMATLASLRDRANPMEPDRARAIAQVAAVLVDTARVEVDYVKATSAGHADFLAPRRTAPSDPDPTAIAAERGAHNPWGGAVTRHQLKG